MGRDDLTPEQEKELQGYVDGLMDEEDYPPDKIAAMVAHHRAGMAKANNSGGGSGGGASGELICTLSIVAAATLGFGAAAGGLARCSKTVLVRGR